jgi:hypothetical protein
MLEEELANARMRLLGQRDITSPMNETTDFARVNEEFREQDRLRDTNYKLEAQISELHAQHRNELAVL